MKTHLFALGLLGILCSTAFSQSLAEKDLYEKLAAGPESVQALETVLKKPDEYSAAVLYTGAGAAFREKRLEDSAFLFYTAQLRAHFDQICFPPKGKGGNSPLVAYAALAQPLGRAINPAVMAQPKIFEKALARVKKWTPKAPKEYEPGYEFTERKSEQDAHEAARPNRVEFMQRMSGLSTLLSDAEYYAAFRTIQAYNSSSDDKRPTQEAKDQATETMKRIEKDKGIKGFFGK